MGMDKRLAVLGAWLAAFCLGYGAADCAAQASLLAETELALGSKSCTAQLYGEVLGGGYAKDLLLLVKDREEGRLLSAYSPDISGGYGCRLEAVPVTGRGEQLLLLVQEGDWRRPQQVRLLDFAQPKAVRQLFDAGCSRGLIQQAALAEAGGRLQLTTRDGQTAAVALDQEVTPEAGRQLAWGGLDSVVPLDLDGDGLMELLTVEKVSYGGQALARLGAAWHYQGGAQAASSEDQAQAPQQATRQASQQGPQQALQDWLAEARQVGTALQGGRPVAAAPAQSNPARLWQRQGLVLLAARAVSKDNRVNQGVNESFYRVWPQAALRPGGEATLPLLTVSGDSQLQNRLNAALRPYSQQAWQNFKEGKEDAAYQVLTAADKVLSLELLTGREQVRRRYLNLDPHSGKELPLKALLATEDPGLRPLLAALSTNPKLDFKKGLPQDWYILEGDKLCFRQLVDGQEETAGFALGNLRKFLRPAFLAGQEQPAAPAQEGSGPVSPAQKGQ